MNNFLDNGTVLPSGLLNESMSSRLEGFNKSYRDTPLRAGVIVASYSVNDPENRTKLATEYDVTTVQQNEDRGATTINYRKCLSSDALGGIADFFEMNFRQKTQQTYSGQAVRFAGQNGSIVLLLCLDGTSNKAMIVGGFPHPDRETALVDTQPRLQGEYNGVNIAINPDGSTSLTFKGATDNDGNVIDPSQGTTKVQISTDGSFSVTNQATTLNMAKSGVITITAKGDIDINTQANNNVTISGNSTTNVTGNSVLNVSGDCDITAKGKVMVTAPEIDLNGNSSDPGKGVIDSNGTYSVVDFITGVPVLPSPTVFIDV